MFLPHLVMAAEAAVDTPVGEPEVGTTNRYAPKRAAFLLHACTYRAGARDKFHVVGCS